MRLTSGKLLAFAIAAAGLIVAVGPEFRHGDLPVPLHHVLHAVAIAGGAALAVALMRPSRDTGEHAAWLIPAILAPIAVMLMMWPSLYETLDANPALHVADHAALFFIGYLTVTAGQRYRAGAGIALGVISVLMALTAAGGFGAYLG